VRPETVIDWHRTKELFSVILSQARNWAAKHEPLLLPIGVQAAITRCHM
jgi:hypothetical protein